MSDTNYELRFINYYPPYHEKKTKSTKEHAQKGVFFPTNNSNNLDLNKTGARDAEYARTAGSIRVIIINLNLSRAIRGT